MALSTVTFDSVPMGMNVSVPPYEIDDRQARYIQDGVLNEPGQLNRRGPVQAISVSGQPSTRGRGVGIFVTSDPAGNTRVGVLTDAASGTDALFVYDENGAYLGNFDWPYALSTATAYSLYDAKPALGGGIWIGTMDQYYENNNAALALWRGGYDNNYSAGTAQVNRGSTVVTGTTTTWTAGMVGSHLFDSAGSYIGTVASFGSVTSLTLEQPARFNTLSATAAYSIRPVRGFIRHFSTGTIVCNTGSTTVTGLGTKFLSQGWSTSTNIFRASDLTFVGVVNATPTSDTGLVLAANAGVNMDNEPYIAVNSVEASKVQLTSTSGLSTGTTEFSLNVGTRSVLNTPGALTASHAFRQWYANLPIFTGATGEYTSRVWFSETTHGESVDFSTKSGNFIKIPSSFGAAQPIRALIPTRGGLLVLKENEAWIITGTDKTNFAIRKLSDDGAPVGMSAIPFAGGAFWAGKQGIYWFDGTNLNNLVNNSLGDYYTQAVGTFPWNTKRMWSTVFRDHLLIHIEQTTPPVSILKANVASVPSKLCIVINLATRALVMFYNVEHHGGVIIPKRNVAWYLVTENSTNKYHICDGGQLFDSEGNDSIICAGNTVAGPDFYWETKRMTLGDAMRKKLWKLFMIHYFATGDGLRLDVVTGINEEGVTNASTWAVSGSTWAFIAATYNSWADVDSAFTSWADMAAEVWLKKKVRFLKRDQMVGFRIYQNSTAVSSLRFGPFQVAYKPLRAGRL